MVGSSNFQHFVFLINSVLLLPIRSAIKHTVLLNTLPTLIVRDASHQRCSASEMLGIEDAWHQGCFVSLNPCKHFFFREEIMYCVLKSEERQSLSEAEPLLTK